MTALDYILAGLVILSAGLNVLGAWVATRRLRAVATELGRVQIVVASMQGWELMVDELTARRRSKSIRQVELMLDRIIHCLEHDEFSDLSERSRGGFRDGD